MPPIANLSQRVVVVPLLHYHKQQPLPLAWCHAINFQFTQAIAPLPIAPDPAEAWPVLDLEFVNRSRPLIPPMNWGLGLNVSI